MREITRRLFTVDEYYRMAEAGILTPEDRVELMVTDNRAGEDRGGESAGLVPVGGRGGFPDQSRHPTTAEG